jgi:hypothetical protein
MVAMSWAGGWVSVADSELSDEGPSPQDGSALPRRQDLVPYRAWSGVWTSRNDGDVTAAAPAVPELPNVDVAATRSLPAVLADDSWSDPPGRQGAADLYLGFHQAHQRRRRTWLVVCAVLFGLAALAAIPLALVGSPHGQDRTDALKAVPSAGAPTDELIAPASLVPAVGQTAQTTQPAATASAAPPAPAFTPLTLRADTAQINRPARIITYDGASDGSIVTNIGAWKHDSGSIQFTDVTIPATGTYVITIYYVNLADPTTSAEIAVSDARPVVQTFTGTDVCCASTSLPRMGISAGTHTITIGNQNGPGPSIDKIVISQP